MKKYLFDFIQNVLRNIGLFTLAICVFVSLFDEQAKAVTRLAEALDQYKSKLD